MPNSECLPKKNKDIIGYVSPRCIGVSNSPILGVHKLQNILTSPNNNAPPITEDNDEMSSIDNLKQS